MFRFADKDNDGKIRCFLFHVTFCAFVFQFISATKNLKLWSTLRSCRWRQSRVWKVARPPPRCTWRGWPSWAARTRRACPSPTLWTTWAWTGPRITSWSTSHESETLLLMVPVTLCPVVFPLRPATCIPALATLPGDGQDTHPSHITQIDQSHYKASQVQVFTLDPIPLK